VDESEFLRGLPKVELHCHLEGAIRPETAFELARKHQVELPADEPAALYDYDNLVDFLKVYVAVSSAVRDHEDFARIAYEALEDGAVLGNLRYREMFFNPTNHYEFGADYRTVVDGVIEGVRGAEADHGVRCRLIAAINKSQGPQYAMEFVQEILDDPREEIIGIGSDHLASDNLEAPERFAEAYRLAATGGLRLTAHAGEIDSSSDAEVRNALDALGCSRIDHGYHVLDGPDLVRRVRDEGVPFTCGPHSSEVLSGWSDYTAHPIKRMYEQGLTVTFNTDDPPMFHTDIGREYVDTIPRMGLSLDDAVRITMNGVEASWLDDTEKRALRQEFENEIDALRTKLGSTRPAG
jgi:adenosine deaminase